MAKVKKKYKVQATARGYYNHHLYEEEQTFSISSLKHFSKVWMKSLDSELTSLLLNKDGIELKVGKAAQEASKKTPVQAPAPAPEVDPEEEEDDEDENEVDDDPLDEIDENHPEQGDEVL